MSDLTYSAMPPHFSRTDEKLKAKITNVEALSMIFLRQWCEIPSLEPVHPKLNGFNGLELGEFHEFLDFFFVHSVIFIVVELFS